MSQKYGLTDIVNALSRAMDNPVIEIIRSGAVGTLGVANPVLGIVGGIGNDLLSKYNDFKVSLSSRNSIYLIYKNMPLLQLIINAPALLFGFFVKWLFFVRKGFGRTYLKGIAEGIRTCGKNCRKVPFKIKHLGNYIKIEWELICGTFVYAYELFRRKLSK